MKHHKYLGVNLDSKMAWIQHIAYVKTQYPNELVLYFRQEPILIGEVLTTYTMPPLTHT